MGRCVRRNAPRCGRARSVDRHDARMVGRGARGGSVDRVIPGACRVACRDRAKAHMALTLGHLRVLMRQTSIGLDLGRSADGRYLVHAVGVRGHGIRWRQSATLDADPDLATTLGTFLRALPRRRAPRPSVAVALGPASIQLKRLPRLPSLSDSRALTSLVRENVSRFFVHNGLPLMTSALRVDAPGDAWGAAVERPLLDAVARACAIAKCVSRALFRPQPCSDMHLHNRQSSRRTPAQLTPACSLRPALLLRIPPGPLVLLW